MRIVPAFRDYSSTNRTAENRLLGSEHRHDPAFLLRAHMQSGFGEVIRRTQSDHMFGFGYSGLTFVSALGTTFVVSHMPDLDRDQSTIDGPLHNLVFAGR
jgi:hypothetical protein